MSFGSYHSPDPGGNSNASAVGDVAGVQWVRIISCTQMRLTAFGNGAGSPRSSAAMFGWSRQLMVMTFQSGFSRMS
jgi:hypothetical protein